MYAIIEVAGEQRRVEPNGKVVINRVQGNVGEKVTLDKVLLISNEKVEIGMPYVSGAKVDCKIVKHTRGKKVVTLKYKKRKGYRKTIGHRQDLTELLVEKIHK